VVAVVAVVGAVLTACSGTGGSGPPTAAPSSSPGSPGAGARAGRPNIVFVLTDDLSTNLVRYLPHVLALQRAGTSFTNYTVTDSLCCPSRSSLFSGRFPHDTGVFTNTGDDGGFGVFHSRGEETDTFATDLQKVGYRTAMMGKDLNGYQPEDSFGGSEPYVPPGWSEWDVAGNGYPEYGYDLNQNHTVVHHGHAPQDYLTDVLAGRADDFITAAAAAHTPFLIEVATFAPHAPYTPAPPDQDAFPGLTAPRGAAFDTLPTDPPSWLAGRPALTGKQLATIDKDFRKRAQAVQAVDRLLARIESALARTGTAGTPCSCSAPTTATTWVNTGCRPGR
jgi:N-acetylglucosamine-6-sulfatase